MVEGVKPLSLRMGSEWCGFDSALLEGTKKWDGPDCGLRPLSGRGTGPPVME